MGWGSIKKVGRGIKKAGKAVGKGAAKGGKAVGKGVAKGATVVGKGAAKGGKAVGKGVAKGGKVVGKGVAKGATVIGKNTARAGKYVGGQAARGGKIVGGAAVSAGRYIGKKVTAPSAGTKTKFIRAGGFRTLESFLNAKGIVYFTKPEGAVVKIRFGIGIGRDSSKKVLNGRQQIALTVGKGSLAYARVQIQVLKSTHVMYTVVGLGVAQRTPSIPYQTSN